MIISILSLVITTTTRNNNPYTFSKSGITSHQCFYQLLAAIIIYNSYIISENILALGKGPFVNYDYYLTCIYTFQKFWMYDEIDCLEQCIYRQGKLLYEGAFFRENIKSSKVYEKWKSNSEFM